MIRADSLNKTGVAPLPPTTSPPLEQDGADQADDRLFIGEDADDVGPPLDYSPVRAGWLNAAWSGGQEVI